MGNYLILDHCFLGKLFVDYINDFVTKNNFNIIASSMHRVVIQNDKTKSKLSFSTLREEYLKRGIVNRIIGAVPIKSIDKRENIRLFVKKHNNRIDALIILDYIKYPNIFSPFTIEFQKNKVLTSSQLKVLFSKMTELYIAQLSNRSKFILEKRALINYKFHMLL